MKNKVLKILLILVIFLLVILSIYKFFSKKDSEIKSNNEYIQVKVNEEKIQTQNNGDYTNNYLEYEKQAEYKIVIDEVGINGKIFIDENGYMYIQDNIKNITKKISEIKFLTLRIRYNFTNIISLYAISEDNTLYNIYLKDTDINSVKINKVETSYSVAKFVNLYFKSPENTNDETFTVLSTDGKVYDITTGLMYRDDILYLNGNYYAFKDNKIANSIGNIIKDEKNNYVKIKYYIEAWEEKTLFENSYSIVITEDNRIMYSENGSEYVKFYKEKIKDIKYTRNEEIENEFIIKITLENNKIIEFSGLCFEGYYNFK